MWCAADYPSQFSDFIAKLVYHGTTVGKDKKVVREQLNATQRQLWTDFLKKQAMAGLPQLVLQAHGDQLYGVPAMMPVTRKLKVFRPGILLGTFKKKRFEPSYALALASDDLSLPKTEITREQWALYVHGETFELTSAPVAGFRVLTCDGLPAELTADAGVGCAELAGIISRAPQFSQNNASISFFFPQFG
ncbi:hypothetical protein WP50_18320, partial [Lactiplantibacillus plantarum]